MPPRDYFTPLIEKAGEAAFENQCIPIAEKLLGLDSYKAFLASRRQLIAKRLKQFLTSR